jgi:hypothetical protein
VLLFFSFPVFLCSILAVHPKKDIALNDNKLQTVENLMKNHPKPKNSVEMW